MSEDTSKVDPIKTQKMKDISCYHNNDVVCVRGHRKTHGMQMYQDLVKEEKQRYIATSDRLEKRRISKSIISAIRNLNPPGRFLVQDPASKLWYDIGEKKAMVKTYAALRERGLQKECNTDETPAATVERKVDRMINAVPSIKMFDGSAESSGQLDRLHSNEMMHAEFETKQSYHVDPYIP